MTQGMSASSSSSRRAFSSLSLTPASSTYSMSTRLRPRREKRRVHSSTSAMGQRRLTGMMRARVASSVAFSDSARLHGRRSSIMRRMPGTWPTVDSVTRRGEKASPLGSVAMRTKRATASKLCSGSPMPISTRLRGRWPCSRSAASTCATISSVVRLRSSPPRAVRQKAQSIAQPTCVDTHWVSRPWPGISTVSTRLPSGMASSILRVPSLARSSRTRCSASGVSCSASQAARRRGRPGMAAGSRPPWRNTCASSASA